MYEVVWDTTKFNNRNEWPADGSQPFVLSTGDPTGLGQHGDYVFGWKDDSLQRAMDTSGCFGASCANLRTQSIDAARKCAVKQAAKEEHDACELPRFLPSFPFLVLFRGGCVSVCSAADVRRDDRADRRAGYGGDVNGFRLWGCWEAVVERGSVEGD
jgi:hypothetical protein